MIHLRLIGSFNRFSNFYNIIAASIHFNKKNPKILIITVTKLSNAYIIYYIFLKLEKWSLCYLPITHPTIILILQSHRSKFPPCSSSNDATEPSYIVDWCCLFKCWELVFKNVQKINQFEFNKYFIIIETI